MNSIDTLKSQINTHLNQMDYKYKTSLKRQLERLLDELDTDKKNSIRTAENKIVNEKNREINILRSEQSGESRTYEEIYTGTGQYKGD